MGPPPLLPVPEKKSTVFFILHFFGDGSLKRFQDDQMAEWDIHCNSWPHTLGATQGQDSRKVKSDCQSKVKEKTVLVLTLVPNMIVYKKPPILEQKKRLRIIYSGFCYFSSSSKVFS